MTALPASAAVGGDSRTTGLLLGLLLALTAFVQLTVVSRSVVEGPLRADAGEYFSYAWNLSHHGVYSSTRPGEGSASGAAPAPDKLRSPGYPLFLLAVGTPEASEDYVHRIALVQALLGVGSVLLAYLIAAQFLGRGWALAPALLMAVSPHITMSSVYVLTEALFTFLLLASTYASVCAARRGNLALAAVAGLSWGACTLVRPTVEFLPLLLTAGAFLVPRFRRLRKPAALMLLGFALVMAPWVIRNAGVTQPGPSLMVNSMAHGAYPDFMFEDRPETFGFPYRFDPAYSDHIVSLGSLLSHLKESFASDPLRYGEWFLIGKPYFFLSLRDVQSLDIQIYPTPINPYYDRPFFAVMRSLSISLHWPLMISGLVGLVMVALRLRKTHPDRTEADVSAALVSLVVLYAIGLHMVAAPFPRYAIPFRPLIYALAMIPALAAWSKLRARARA